MKKNKAKIKDNINLSRQNEIDAINMIANMFFKDILDDNGNIIDTQYTPYLEETAIVNVIVRYYLEGIEIEDEEDIFDEVMDDDELYSLVVNFKEYHREEIDRIMQKVYDIVEYRKAENLARIQSESNSLLMYKILELIENEQGKLQKEAEAAENLNLYINQMRNYQENLNAVIPIEKHKEFFEKFDINDLTNSIYQQIAESDLHKRNQEVVELARDNREKDNKIAEKDDKIIELEKQLNKKKKK